MFAFIFERRIGRVQIFYFTEEFVGIAQLLPRVGAAVENHVASPNFSHHGDFFFFFLHGRPQMFLISLWCSADLLISVLILPHQIVLGYEGSVRLWFEAFSFFKKDFWNCIFKVFFFFSSISLVFFLGCQFCISLIPSSSNLSSTPFFKNQLHYKIIYIQ